MKISSSIIYIFIFLLFCSTRLYAGDIPGIPIVQPPGLHEDFQIQLSNDFFSLLANADDFRTQQISLSAKLSDKWLFIFDQSLLTLRGAQYDQPDPIGTEGRLDQLSVSLAYQFYHQQHKSNIDQLLIGTGLRSYGNFDGARIQNGVHRMLNNDLVNLPYVDTERTDVVIWLRASKQHYFTSENKEVNSSLRLGYWLDGSALFTTDVQFDATLGAYGLLKLFDIDFWYGLRGDWREGYDRDIVQQSVAEHERGVSLALGFAYGSLRLETIGGVGDNDNSFGRLVLTASNDPGTDKSISGPTIAYQFGLLSPEVAIQNQLRWSPQESNKPYRVAWVFDYRYGTASTNDTATQFNISQQYVLGVDVSLASKSSADWLQPYFMIGAGYRSEYLEGQGVLASEQSNKVSSPVLVGDLGLRLYMAGKPNKWQLQFQLGLTGWVPLQSEQVDFNNQRVEVLKTDTSWTSGVSIMWQY